MDLLIFSDIHADYAALERLMKQQADLYFAAGDLVNWGRGLERMGPILARRGEQCYVMPGNHESEQEISAFCEQFKLHDFHGQTLKLENGYTVAGLGYSNSTPFNTPGEYTEEEIAARLDAFTGISPLILICHCPPKDTPLDRVREGVHFGSTAVRDFIEREQPEYFVCGHIHEAAGSETVLGRTRCRNLGKKGFVLTV